MTKKVKHRILYITVALLWIIALYRTWQNHVLDSSAQEEAIVSMPPIAPVQFRKDSFELELPDRDPFLDQNWKPAVTPEIKTETNQPVIKPTTIEKPIQRTPWPAIEYYGFVKNRDRNSTLCLMKINGILVKLSQGDSHDGVEIIQVFRDSMRVRYDKELRTFRK